MLAREKGWGEQKNIMYRGTPVHFFSVCFLSHFQANYTQGSTNKLTVQLNSDKYDVFDVSFKQELLISLSI